VFQERGLTIRAGILEETGRGIILEIAFDGSLFYYRNYQRIEEFAKEAARKRNPVAVVFNFLGYRYRAGDEIEGPIINANIDSEHHTLLLFALSQKESRHIISSDDETALIYVLL
jgi:hypothetical protein